MLCYGYESLFLYTFIAVFLGLMLFKTQVLNSLVLYILVKRFQSVAEINGTLATQMSTTSVIPEIPILPISDPKAKLVCLLFIVGVYIRLLLVVEKEVWIECPNLGHFEM